MELSNKNPLAETNRTRGGTTIELVCSLPILVFLFIGILEIVRIACFHATLAVAAWDIATGIASRQIFLEENGLLFDAQEYHNDAATPLTGFLEEELNRFLDAFPSRRGIQNAASQTTEQKDFRLYLQRSSENGESGFRVHIVACLPYLSLSFHQGQSKAGSARNCLGQFSPPLEKPSIGFHSDAFHLRASAFVPRYASYAMFHHGIGIPTKFLGVNTHHVSLAQTFELGDRFPRGSREWFKNNRRMFEESAETWFAQSSLQGELLSINKAEP